MSRVEEQSLQPYQPYTGERLASSADFADIGASRDMTRGIANSGIAGLNTAAATAEANIARANELGNYDTGTFTAYDYNPARQFTGAEVDKYMSPYIQNVLDVQKSRAIEDYDRLRGSRNTRAMQAGAFGGSRQAVQEGIAEESLLRNMSEIEATGRQKAFEQAASLFGTDRAAEMQREEDMAAERARVETGTEASRQFGAGQGLAAIEASGMSAEQLARLGEKERETKIQNAQLLESIGKDQMAEAQAGMDVGFQDWLRQQGAPEESLAFYSEILRGLPVANAGETTSTGSVYTNPAQQALGAGLTGLSLYKAYGA
jgi:hypothetical protein